jgi:hypothetical protein
MSSVRARIDCSLSTVAVLAVSWITAYAIRRGLAVSLQVSPRSTRVVTRQLVT